MSHPHAEELVISMAGLGQKFVVDVKIVSIKENCPQNEWSYASSSASRSTESDVPPTNVAIEPLSCLKVGFG